MSSLEKLTETVEKIRLENEIQLHPIKSDKQRSEEFFIGVQRRLFGDSPTIEAVCL